MKKLILPMIVAMAVGTSFPALADNDNFRNGSDRNFFERLGDSIADLFDGDDDLNDGNQNAVNQIDRNLDKHGGDHHGLENARAAVSKEKHDRDDDSLLEEIAEDINDANDDLFDDGKGRGFDKNDDHPGNGNGKAKGK